MQACCKVERCVAVMKDEPEDLTHLAPSCGPADAACVPLFSGPLLNDMLLDHFMLSENYGPLLSETKDISPASSPYFSYRDELSSGSLSPPLTHVSLHLTCGCVHSPAIVIGLARCTSV